MMPHSRKVESCIDEQTTYSKDNTYVNILSKFYSFLIINDVKIKIMSINNNNV